MFRNFHKGWLSLSIRCQRSRAYFLSAFALVAIIPALAFYVVTLSLYTDRLVDSVVLQVGVAISGAVALAAGYAMLRAYPTNLERLRDYLSRIAADELHFQAHLSPAERDVGEIEVYLNQIIDKLHRRIAQLDAELDHSRALLETVRKLSETMVEAERQRVMIESLGAVCHHIGQPTTVLSLYLTNLHDNPGVILEENELNACLEAVESITVILKKLMDVSEYRTIPYIDLESSADAPPKSQINILDIA